MYKSTTITTRGLYQQRVEVQPKDFGQQPAAKTRLNIITYRRYDREKLFNMRLNKAYIIYMLLRDKFILFTFCIIL